MSHAAILSPFSRDSIEDDNPSECIHVEVIELKNHLPTHAKKPHEIVYFPLTVDESLSIEAQQLMSRSCGDSISSLKVEPLLHKHQSKIWISMKATAYSIAIHTIIFGLPSAELGPVVHMSAALQG